jgi:hypothetical protein
MVEQSFVNQNLSVKAQLSLYQGKHGQILVYDFYENILYMLALSDTAVVEDIQLKDSSGIGNFILVILILLLIGIAGIFSYRKSTSRKRSVKVLSKDHLRFNFKANQKLIQLFKGDKKVPFQTMNLDQISGYQLLLNGNVISAVSGSKESVMSNLKEKTIRDEFDNEHFHKLDEQETRQIEVNILTDDAKYLACLYFRKGNSRIIGGKYFSEVEHAIEFGWAVSMSLNAGDTEQREIKNIVIKPIPSVAARLGEFRNQQQINEPSPTPVQLSEQSEPNALLSGLDKLIELHKQGLLSDEEFRQAKAKLLQ